MSTRAIQVLPTVAELARAAAERFISLCGEAIADHGRFTVALAGGSTPKAMYELLAAEPYRSQVDWTRVQVYFGDERCVPPDHKESNFRMAQEAMLSKVPIPGDHVYRMAGERDPETAAREYGILLRDQFGDDGMDLVLLGMGTDGHTMSLFPGTAAVREREHRVVANFAEHSTTGKSWRITLTAPFVNRCRHVLVLVAGAEKAAVLKEVLENPVQPEEHPIKLIQPSPGALEWMIDAAAGGM